MLALLADKLHLARFTIPSIQCARETKEDVNEHHYDHDHGRVNKCKDYRSRNTRNKKREEADAPQDLVDKATVVELSN